MRKFKKLVGYILGFISSVLLTILVLLFVFKITIFNQNYVLQKLEDNNYYEEVTESIKRDMGNSLMSSGLDKSILDGIFKDGDIKVDIKGFIASIYTGSKYKVDTDSLKKKINSNIDEYLKEKGLEATDKKSLETYVDGVVKIYKDGINIYGYLDGVISSFAKISTYTDMFIGFIIVFIIVCLVVIRKWVHKRYSGVVCLSSSLMLLYFRWFIFDGIDFKNIIIISDSFSKVIRKVLIDVGDKVIIVSMVLLIISIFIV